MSLLYEGKTQLAILPIFPEALYQDKKTKTDPFSLKNELKKAYFSNIGNMRVLLSKPRYETTGFLHMPKQ